jgi:tetratricopeptide (TPR) repeat protein
MAADPLKEVLQKVIQERREQIDQLSAQLQNTFDPVDRDDLDKKIAKLQAELIASEQALTHGTAPTAPQQPVAQVVPETPVIPVEQPRINPDQQLLGSEPVAPGPKGPSKAGLEAQIRELQTQLLDAALAVEKGGPSPNPMDVAHLREVREKLQAAMQQIGGVEIQVDIGEMPPKPTPAQLTEADNLIKRSMLEKRRGNNQAAGDLLRKAAEVAPGSPIVLEALGDDIMERGQAKPAVDIYARALKIQPGNANIERKYAIAVAKSKGAVTLEEAMQLSLGDGPLSAADAANARIAAVLSFFIPGAGQVVLGDYIKGAAYFGGWLIMLMWLSLSKNQLHDLVDSLAGKKSGFNPLVLLPILGSLAISIAAAVTCKKPGSGPAELPKKGRGPRPTPPVDLPFE